MKNTSFSSIILISIFSLQLSFGQNNTMPPLADKIPRYDTIHNDIRVDNYHWMKDKTSKKTLAYLKAENKYTEKILKSNKDLEEKLYQEILSRIKQTDLTVPYKLRGYWYYTRTVEGKDYVIYCRKKGDLNAAEEILLDENTMAKGHKYYSINDWDISLNNEIIAYFEDITGDFESTVYFKNLTTGELLDDKLEKVTSLAWANDNKTIFYTVQDSINRSYKVFKHVLGSKDNDQLNDQLVFHEKGERFNVYTFKSKSDQYIFIASSSTTSTEYRFLNADHTDVSFKLIHLREKDHLYYVSHYEDNFYITSNKDAINFKLLKTNISKPDISNWSEIIPHRENVFLTGVDIFKDYLVVSERENGLLKIRIIKWDDWSDHYLDFDEPTYTTYPSTNLNFNTTILRYVYSSMITPKSVYEYDMTTREKILLKQTEVLGGYDKSNYVTERLWAEANDGKLIPISLVYKKGIKLNGETPLYITSYGSYGGSSYAYFSSIRLSLLNRGFIHATAHVRGGSDLGRQWYEDGKMLNKKNTFTDFIACTEHLIKENYTSKGKVVAYGVSAGGLLMGAIANMRPDLYKVIILDAPFVDVINTMLDPTIPLTTEEYEEWGNPNDKEYYDYIKSYSPYNNVKAQEYPNMLFITGINDEQVGCWEPAKMVAKLRKMKTDNNILLLKTDMGSGHSGPSGRYSYYKETAFMYAFIIKLFEIGE